MEPMNFKQYCSRRGVYFEEKSSAMIFRSRMTFSDKFKGYYKESKAVNKCCQDVLDWLLEFWKDDFNDVYTITNYCGGIHGEYYVILKHTVKRKNDMFGIREETEVRNKLRQIGDCLKEHNNWIESCNNK